MKRLITLLTVLTVLSLTAFAGEDHKNYVANIGTRYELHEDTLIPVPLQCELSLSDTGAAISFRDYAGLHTYSATKVERVSETEYVFRGFSAYLPDGMRGRFLGAQIMEDGAIMVLFGCVSERYPRALIFNKK